MIFNLIRMRQDLYNALETINPKQIMSPSENQLRNLHEMTTILSDNRKARILAHSLWEFYNYQLYCTVRADDGKPNRHRIDGITGPKTIGKIRICISIRNNERQGEGLVHELLHANLIPLGYPRFWVEESVSKKRRLAEGIVNLADHIVMQPIYLSLGYSAERFLGFSRPLGELERRVAGDLQQIAANLATPDGYLTHLSAYLRLHNINCKPLLDLAATVVAQRHEYGDGIDSKR
jgi:hypothetical protein